MQINRRRTKINMKWEYLNITIMTGVFAGGPEKVTRELNEYGQAGWELVNFQFVPDNGMMCFVFKRPIF